MAGNKTLTKAKEAKKDEFYTRYEDIQAEINHYEPHFKGKTVFCNCDDPFESNFCKFFLKNFNYLGLKRLICTSFATSPVAGSQLSIFDEDNEPVISKHGYVMDISEVPMANGRGVSDDDIYALLRSQKRGVKRLKKNGDFRSPECIEYLKQADIVVTNPPFSLFREYVAQLIEYKKDFLIIGNVNAVTYKEIFPLIKDNILWMGASIHSGDRQFYVPDTYPLNAAGCGIDDCGRKFIRVKGVRWFTNLDYARRHEELVLYKRYYGNEDEYPRYDNYDAINVDKTSDIPCDYFENMGVPITYLDKYNSDQFEIVDANDIRNEGVREKHHGLIKDKEATVVIPCSQIVNVEREREREREAENDLRSNRHQTEDVTASWACQSPSSISTTPNNLKSSDLTDMSRTTRDTDTDLQLTAERPTPASSSSTRCNGIMGVPITFLDKYNPDQFEIIGMAKRGAGDPKLKTKVYTKEDYPNYSDLNAGPVIIKNGRPQNTYPRILIRRKNEHNTKTN